MDVEQRARLPGYRDEAVVRHFDAPDAIKTRFYEVHAKSILNRVPEASRMPFRWTINPYRGCTHACEFCFARPTHTLPRLRRRPGLRARDRRQGQCARAAARRAGRAVVEGRARRARHEHRPVPVGRGALQADAGDLGGDARGAQPVLGADQVAAAAAGSRADAGARRQCTEFGAALSVPTLDERPGARPSRTRPTRGRGWRRSRELTRAGIRTGVLIAPLMPGINDSPEQVEPILELASEAGAAYVTRDRAAPARGGAGAVLRLAGRAPARPGARATRSSTAAARMRRRQERRRLAGLVAGTDRGESRTGRAAPQRPSETAPNRLRSPARRTLFETALRGETVERRRYA